MFKCKCVSMLQNTFKLNNDSYLFGWYLKRVFTLGHAKELLLRNNL